MAQGEALGTAYFDLMARQQGLNAGLLAAGNTLRGWHGRMAKFATIAIGVVGIAAVVKGLNSVVSAAASFEQAMADVRAVTQPTAQQFEQLEQTAKELGKTTKFTMTDIAAGMEALGRAGFSTTEIIGSMAGVADMAAAASISLGEAADIASKTIRALGLEASESTRVADVLAQAAASSNTTVTMLGESLKYIAPIARSAGFSLEETVAAVAKLGDVGIQGCYDDQTDVLTRRGWISWQDARMDDEFATLNPESNEIEYQSPSRLVRYRHNGCMYQVRNQSIDLSVTPDHRMWVMGRGQEAYEVLTAEEVAGRQVRYQTGAMEWRGNDAATYRLPGFQQYRGSWVKEVSALEVDAELWAAFLGWYISEGSSDVHRGNYRVRITQRPGDVRDRMRSVLAMLPWAVVESKDGFSITNQQLWNEVRRLGKAHEKRIPQYAKEWSPRLLRLLLAALIEGDGDQNGAYYTSSIQLRDDVMETALKLGFSTSIYLVARAGHETNLESEGRPIRARFDQWKVNIRKRSHPWFTPSEYTGAHGARLDGSRHEAFEGWVEYDGEVFCAEVPNHLLIVRRNGKAIVSGNSMAGTSLRFAFSELIATSGDFVDQLHEMGVSLADITGPGGELLQFSEILGVLTEHGATTAEVIAMVGKRAGPALAALIQNNDGLREMVTLLENASGAAREMAEVRLQTLSGQLEVLRGSWELLKVTIGEKVIPILTRLVQDTLIPTVNRVVEWAEESGALETALESLFSTLAGSFEWVIGNWRQVVTGLEAVGAALAAIVVFTNPILALVSALTALGMALAGGGIDRPVAQAERSLQAFGAQLDYLLNLAVATGSEQQLAGVFERIRIAIREAIEETEDLDIQGRRALYRFSIALFDLQKEVMDLPLGEAVDAWNAGLRELFADWEGMFPVLGDIETAMSQMTTTWEADLLNLRATIALITGDLEEMTEEAEGAASAVFSGITFGAGAAPAGTGPTFGAQPPQVFTWGAPQPPGEAPGGAPGTAPGAVPSPEDAASALAWADAFEQLRAAMEEDPTQALAPLQDFLATYGEIPAALLSGGSAARTLLGDFEQLQRLGMEGLEDEIAILEDILGRVAAETQTSAADVSALAEALGGLNFDDPVAALGELYQLSQQYSKPTEMAMIGASLRQLESFVANLAALPEQLRPENWQAIVDAFDELQRSTTAAIQDGEQLAGFTVGTLRDVWDQLEGMGTPTRELVDMFVRFADELGDKPDLLREIHSILEGALVEQRDLLEAQRDFGQATRETESTIAYLERALGVTSDAAAEAASSMRQAASAAQTLAQSLQAKAISEAGTIFDEIDRVIEELTTGTQTITTTTHAPFETRAGIPKGIPEEVAYEAELSIGEMAERISEISGASGVLSMLRDGMWRLGAGTGEAGTAIEELYQRIQQYTSGMNPEEIAAEMQAAEEKAAREKETAAREAESQAKQALREQERAAEEARREQEQAAKDAATAMLDAFREQFTAPIAQALATGDWMTAAEAIRQMSADFPALSAEAETVSEVLAGVGMAGLNQVDVLNMLTGMEGDLLGVLEKRIQLAEQAGEFDLAEALRAAAGEAKAFFAPEKTWKEKAAEWLDKGWSALIQEAIGVLPEKVSTFASGLFDVFKKGLTDPLAAITSALGLAGSVLDMFVSGLEERRRELQKVLDFYVSSFDRIAGLLGGGGILGALANLAVSAVKMTTLEGVDLLVEGFNALLGVVGSLISSFTSLIQKSAAYQAIQEEARPIWQAFYDLIGEFLWPIAAAIKVVREWLGIQSDVNDETREALQNLNVPIGWKMERLRYEAIRPGEPPPSTGGGAEIEIPPWAEPFGQALGEAIIGLLEGFGISSWTDILEGVREKASRLWSWITSRLPDIMDAADQSIRIVGDFLERNGITLDGIISWIQRGITWFIEEGPGWIEDLTDWLDRVVDAIEAGAAWLTENLPTWNELSASIDNWIDELGGLMDFDGVKSELSGIETQIGLLKRALVYALAVVGGAIVGATAGINPVRWGAAALGAIGGGLAAFLFDLLSPGFQHGGEIGALPGMPALPIGAPVAVKAHVGETIAPIGRSPAFAGAGAGGMDVKVYLGSGFYRECADYMVKVIDRNGREYVGKSHSASGLTRRIG